MGSLTPATRIMASGAPCRRADYFVVYSGSGSECERGQPGAQHDIQRGGVLVIPVPELRSAYSHAPATGSLTIPPNQVLAQVSIQSADVVSHVQRQSGQMVLAAILGLVESGELAERGARPGAGERLAHDHRARRRRAGAAAVLPVAANGPAFCRQDQQRQRRGGITSLQRTGDAFTTEYISGGEGSGNVIMKYQRRRARPRGIRSGRPRRAALLRRRITPARTAPQYISRYLITNGLSGPFILESVFTFQQDGLLWSLNLTNLGQPGGGDRRPGVAVADEHELIPASPPAR